MLTDPAFIKRLEMLYLLARKVLGGSLKADRKSDRKGAGILFTDYKEYLFGDDYRSIDWNIYGRLGELVVKLFEQEEDVYIYVLLDVSRSMAAKSEYARKLAAALGYIALNHSDRLAIYSISDRLGTVLGPCHGRGRIFPMLEALEGTECAGCDTRFVESIRQFDSLRRRRGVIVLISDFFAPDYLDSLRFLRWTRNDVFCVQVLDPAELVCNLKGDVELECVETGRRRKVTITSAEAERFNCAMSDWNERVQSECARRGIGLARARIDIPFEDVIGLILRRGGLVA